MSAFTQPSARPTVRGIDHVHGYVDDPFGNRIELIDGAGISRSRATERGH